MVATWTVQTTQKDRMVLRHSHVFFAAVFFSVLYFQGLFVVLWRLPREIGEIENYVDDVMHTSSWYFGAAQAVIIVVLGKFFLEEIGEETKASPPARS